jgi:hypothetical protein
MFEPGLTCGPDFARINKEWKICRGAPLRRYGKRKGPLTTVLTRHGFFDRYKEEIMIGTILLIVFVLLLIGTLPTYPYSRGWGYYPSGGIGLVLLILVLLLFLGRI